MSEPVFEEPPPPVEAPEREVVDPPRRDQGDEDRPER